MSQEEDATGDDEDDFFGNPLKHLVCRVTGSKNSEITDDIKRKGIYTFRKIFLC